MNFSITTDNFQ